MSIAELAAEAVNSLDWDDVYTKARQRTMRDMTGAFYDEHLAKELAERLASKIVLDTEANRP